VTHSTEDPRERGRQRPRGKETYRSGGLVARLMTGISCVTSDGRTAEGEKVEPTEKLEGQEI